MSDPARTSKQAAAPLRTLLGLKTPDGPGRIIVWDTAEIVVGRSNDSDIVIQDSDASRRHAIFKKTVAGFVVEDLGTSNGTRVNDVQLTSPHLLQVKDAVSIGELTITFIQSRRDPSALGLEVTYASELKGFGSGPIADPGATTLGLVDVAGPFAVGTVGDFDPVNPAPATAGRSAAPNPSAAPRDLDLELAEFFPSEVSVGSSAAPSALSLTVELEGLTPDLRRMLAALRDKIIELPALRIRIKG